MLPQSHGNQRKCSSECVCTYDRVSEASTSDNVSRWTVDAWSTSLCAAKVILSAEIPTACRSPKLAETMDLARCDTSYKPPVRSAMCVRCRSSNNIVERLVSIISTDRDAFHNHDAFVLRMACSTRRMRMRRTANCARGHSQQAHSKRQESWKARRAHGSSLKFEMFEAIAYSTIVIMIHLCHRTPWCTL